MELTIFKVNTLLNSAFKSRPSCNSNLRRLTGNGEGRGYIVAITGSTWQAYFEQTVRSIFQ